MFSFGFGTHESHFSRTYSCYSVSMLSGPERENLQKGGKIIMPPSALDHLTRLNVQYPMLFKLSNRATQRNTHCGVLEFIAEEGRIYVPQWMMQNLCLAEGGLIVLENTSLPVATYGKFQPQSTDFLEISNPKAVMEQTLRNFACLSTGDIIALSYNDTTYEMLVVETKPGNAVSIIECDMNVEFDAPIGYEEPKRPIPQNMEQDTGFNHKEEIKDDVSPEKPAFKSFSGRGVRLDGRKAEQPDFKESESTAPIRGIPWYNYKANKLHFRRDHLDQKNSKDSTPEKQVLAFSGVGRKLREKTAK